MQQPNNCQICLFDDGILKKAEKKLVMPDLDKGKCTKYCDKSCTIIHGGIVDKTYHLCKPHHKELRLYMTDVKAMSTGSTRVTQRFQL